MLMDSDITVEIKAKYNNGNNLPAICKIYKGSNKSTPQEFPSYLFMGAEVVGYSNYNGNYLIDY